jgi:hypothetical protein
MTTYLVNIRVHDQILLQKKHTDNVQHGDFVGGFEKERYDNNVLVPEAILHSKYLLFSHPSTSLQIHRDCHTI